MTVYMTSDVDDARLENLIDIKVSELSGQREKVVRALVGLLSLLHEELIVVVAKADCLVVKPPDLVQVPGVIGVCGGGVDGETVPHLHQHEDVPGAGRHHEDPGHDGDDEGGEEEAGVEGGAQNSNNFALGKSRQEVISETSENIDSYEG